MGSLLINFSKLISKENLDDLTYSFSHQFKGKPGLIITVKSFFKDEEWVNYILILFPIEELVEEFRNLVSKHFKVIFSAATDNMDLIALCVFDGEKEPSKEELESKIKVLEKELVPFFLGEKFLGKLKKQLDIFQNPFQSFFEFTIGYSFLHSLDRADLYSSISLSIQRAKIRREEKIAKLSSELLNIIQKRDFRSVFQPVIDFKNKKVYAYEALTQGPKGSPLERPDMLFKVAALNGIEMELDRITRRMHIERFKQIIGNDKAIKLSLNLGPFSQLFASEAHRDLERLDLNKDRVIWEISEKTYIDDFPTFIRVVEFLKSLDYRIAIDDFGTGTTTFKLIFSIPADTIKIDKSLISDVHGSKEKFMFLERMFHCFRKKDNSMIIEGVEKDEELKTLLDIGYNYYQGFYFFKPASLPASHEEVKEKISQLRFSPDRKFFEKTFNPPWLI